MLLWQPKKLSGKQIFFLELMMVSSACHLLLAFLFFFIYRGHYERFSFEVHSKKQGRPVLFLPLKSCNALLRSSNVVKAIRPKASAVQQKKAVVASNVQKKPAVKPQPKNNAAAKPVTKQQPKQPIAAKKEMPKPNNAKKPATTMTAQTEKKAVTKNVPPGKSTPSSKKTAVAQKKPEPTKPVQKIVKNESVSQKQPEIKKDLMEKHNEPKVQAPTITDPAAALPDTIELALGDDDNVYDEMYAVSPEVARIYFGIQKELGSCWKPPVGLKKDLVCTIVVQFARDGTIADLSVKKPSGVLVYDISARSAVQKMQLPRWASGKEFTIAFRQ